MNITLLSIVAVILAIIAGLWAWTRRAVKSGENRITARAQKEVIDGQAKVNAARVATADSSTGRIERLRKRFTRQ